MPATGGADRLPHCPTYILSYQTGRGHAIPAVAAPPPAMFPPLSARHGLLGSRSRYSNLPSLLLLVPSRHKGVGQHHTSSCDPSLHPTHPHSFQTACAPSGVAPGRATAPSVSVFRVGGRMVGTSMGRRGKGMGTGAPGLGERLAGERQRKDSGERNRESDRVGG